MVFRGFLSDPKPILFGLLFLGKGGAIAQSCEVLLSSESCGGFNCGMKMENGNVIVVIMWFFLRFKAFFC